MNRNQAEGYLSGNNLLINNVTVLSEIDCDTSVLEDELGRGVFIRIEAEKENHIHRFDVGRVSSVKRYLCGYRTYPNFADPMTGTDISNIPYETLFLIIEREDGKYVSILPLLDSKFRGSLKGTEDGKLMLIAETGDTATTAKEAAVLFVSVGEDPYTLMRSSAISITNKMKTGRLRTEKNNPDFINYLGWCTWDAFYFDLSHDKFIEGLKDFKEGGVLPGFVILDDGWLTVKGSNPSYAKLSSFSANSKFEKGLKETVRFAKEEIGLKQVMVWHAAMGYWGGVDAESFPQYRISDTVMNYTEGIKMVVPDYCKAQEFPFGLVENNSIYDFYNDFHSSLRQAGVDGVKVDVQYCLEGSASLRGGAVALKQKYLNALEGSVNTHFKGNMINCMNLENSRIYNALNSNITRTSHDFMPGKPETHGRHLCVNAYISFWAGEFIHPDWDMFQTKYHAGPFHAAARVVAGSPIYVSDKTGSHDFELLKKLVTSEGKVLLPKVVGRPTRDCLFRNPEVENVLLKIFNYNEYSSLLGAFNVKYGKAKGDDMIQGEIRPSDVLGAGIGTYAVYSHNSKEIKLCRVDEAAFVELGELAFEVYTITPVKGGMAVIGLADKFNSGGAVKHLSYISGGLCSSTIIDGGEFIAWCERKPKTILVDDRECDFIYDEVSGKLAINVLGKGEHQVCIFV